MSTRFTRRVFLRSAGAGAAWVALAGAAACGTTGQQDRPERADAPRPNSGGTPGGEASGELAGTSVRGLPPERSGPARVFRSRPDLSPPAVAVDDVRGPAGGVSPGYVFIAPKKGPGQDGPMIVDNAGEPVWFRPVSGEEPDAMDFKVQTYRGEPVLTWWEGVHGGYGQGEYIVADTAYREISRVRAGNGLEGDHHEFLLTDRGTALVTIYAEVPYDLSPFGGREDDTVVEGVVQEIDVASGEVLFEWRSLAHVPIDESHGSLPEDPTAPYDYFHINSIDVDDDGNLLVSSRRTFTVYKIDRGSGEVIWRLGGKRSDFEMAEGTTTLYQHDARRQPDGTITLFDNGGENFSEESRILRIAPDEGTMTATVAREYAHPEGIFAVTQGNAQALPNGNTFVGWGSEPVFSEFDREGNLLFGANLPADVESYRAFRHPWTGRPGTVPDLAAAPDPGGGVTLFASWNGATEVESWQILAGPAPDDLSPAGSVPRTGFETAIAVRTQEPLLAAQALDRSGRPLGTSKAVNVRG